MPTNITSPASINAEYQRLETRRRWKQSSLARLRREFAGTGEVPTQTALYYVPFRSRNKDSSRSNEMNVPSSRRRVIDAICRT